MLFLTFHTENRTPPELHAHIHESPWVVLIPLIGLAIPSLVAGQILIGPMLFSQMGLLGNSVFVLPEHNTLSEMARHYHDANYMALVAGTTLPFWLAMAGIITAWLFIAAYPHLAEIFKKRFALFYHILVRKYGFDDFNQIVLVYGTQDLGHVCYDVSDVKIIDGTLVDGSGRFIRWFAQVARRLQTGYLYHYTTAMVLGVVALLIWYMGGF